MSAATGIDPDFAAVMHELSVQAGGPGQASSHSDLAAGLSTALSALHALGQRIESLEETVSRKFEPLTLAKIEKDVSAIRGSESVNHRLFDSLHRELIGYRDNLIRESLQKPFIRDLLHLFDDLSAIVTEVNATAENTDARPQEKRIRDNLDNLLHYLIEILHRLEVTEMEPEEKADRARHRVLAIEPAAKPEEDGRIVREVKRGFLWHGRVLRPAEVVIKQLP